jgi:hypothetical protein
MRGAPPIRVLALRHGASAPFRRQCSGEMRDFRGNIVPRCWHCFCQTRAMSQGRDLLNDDEPAPRGARSDRAGLDYWPRSLGYLNARPRGIDAPRSLAKTPLCLVPGLLGFLVFSLYPLMTSRLDLLSAVEHWFGPSATAMRIVGNADTLILILGIVLSAICWHFAEQASEYQSR